VFYISIHCLATWRCDAWYGVVSNYSSKLDLSVISVYITTPISCSLTYLQAPLPQPISLDRQLTEITLVFRIQHSKRNTHRHSAYRPPTRAAAICCHPSPPSRLDLSTASLSQHKQAWLCQLSLQPCHSLSHFSFLYISEYKQSLPTRTWGSS
jgi:hypothetical protein